MCLKGAVLIAAGGLYAKQLIVKYISFGGIDFLDFVSENTCSIDYVDFLIKKTATEVNTFWTKCLVLAICNLSLGVFFLVMTCCSCCECMTDLCCPKAEKDPDFQPPIGPEATPGKTDGDKKD